MHVHGPDGKVWIMGAICIILTRDSGRIFRKVEVTTFEEVSELHLKFPKLDIAIFESRDGKTGAMWSFFPEVQDPKFYR